MNGFVAFFVAFSAFTSSHLQSPKLERIVEPQIDSIALPEGLPDSFTASVVIEGNLHELQLSKTPLRSPNFKLYVDVGKRQLREQAPPPVRTYRGTVPGMPGSRVRASLLKNGLSASIHTANENYVIEPLEDENPENNPAPPHLIYKASKVLPSSYTCGNTTATGAGFIPVPQGGQGGIAGTGLNMVEIAFDADFDFYQKNSNSVPMTVADMENVFNDVDQVYQDDVQITYEISAIIVRTAEEDPYDDTDSVNLLCEFRNTWNSSPEIDIQRNVAQLFTGKNLNGSTIGLGYLGVVCNVPSNDCGGFGNVAYSLVESKFLGNNFNERVSLSAHELGHNWNATHCSGPTCHIMCGNIGGCGGITGANLTFNPDSSPEIIDYKNSVSCDFALPDPLTLPFFDNFSSIASSKWIFNKGGSTNSSATGEPSATTSLNLDCTGPDLYEDDEIRSNFILLGGETSVELSYYTEYKNVEAGEKLFVDYFANTGEWININTITSLGGSQANFTQFVHALPANAMHDKFRIRFRTDVDNSADDWFIDDVLIEAVSACPADIDGNGTINGADLGQLLGNWGGSGIGDLNGDNVVNGADLGILLGSWGVCP